MTIPAFTTPEHIGREALGQPVAINNFCMTTLVNNAVKRSVPGIRKFFAELSENLKQQEHDTGAAERQNH